MANHILCVFEGTRTEPNYFKSVEEHYFSEGSVVKCSYGNNLYSLAEELAADEDLDIVELIRESVTVPDNRELLNGFERDDIAQVFLFFDMEPQDSRFSEERLSQMLALFREETEHGKLYISYPMIEALRDVPSFAEYAHLTVSVDDIRGYKRLSAERGRAIPNEYRLLTKEHWKSLIECNVSKAQWLSRVGQLTELVLNNEDWDRSEQLHVMAAQLSKLNSEQQIYVLCAFPLFLYDYFGNQQLGVSI